VVKPLGEARPAWKVLRLLANQFELAGFDQESSLDVLRGVFGNTVEVPQNLPVESLSNACSAAPNLAVVNHVPCVASIYALDALVRRAPSLQLTADARVAADAVETQHG